MDDLAIGEAAAVVSRLRMERQEATDLVFEAESLIRETTHALARLHDVVSDLKRVVSGARGPAVTPEPSRVVAAPYTPDRTAVIGIVRTKTAASIMPTLAEQLPNYFNATLHEFPLNVGVDEVVARNCTLVLLIAYATSSHFESLNLASWVKHIQRRGIPTIVVILRYGGSKATKIDTTYRKHVPVVFIVFKLDGTIDDDDMPTRDALFTIARDTAAAAADAER